MFKSSDFTKLSYKTGEVAKLLSVTNKTIQNYDHSGKLKVHRTATDRRCILRNDLLCYLENEGMLFRDEHENKVDVIYARVSSGEQKIKGDLDRQVVYILENVSELKNPVVLKEVGSGLNDKRTQIQKLLQMVMNGEVSRIFVTYKDRLTRFGYHYLEAVCDRNDVEIVTVQDEGAKKTVEQELVMDMMDLVASFSGKVYGLRSRKNRKAV